jgi:Spy/CpxP family protein refolding chaperone
MKWKALVVLLGVFLLGVGGGVVLDRVALPRDGLAPHGVWGRHQPPVSRLLQRLTHDLDLSDAQQQDVRAIVMSTRTELDTTRQQMRQRVDDILKASETRIQSVLKPEQREAFKRLMAERRERRKQRQHFRKRHMHRDSENHPNMK